MALKSATIAQGCQHKHLYIWAENGAEYGRCYDCQAVILQRVFKKLTGLYPTLKPEGKGKHHRYSAGVGSQNPSFDNVIKTLER